MQTILWTTIGLLLYAGIMCGVALHVVNVRKADAIQFTSVCCCLPFQSAVLTPTLAFQRHDGSHVATASRFVGTSEHTVKCSATLCVNVHCQSKYYHLGYTFKAQLATSGLQDQYLPSHRLGYLITIERSLWAVLSFAIWFRLLKCAFALLLAAGMRRYLSKASKFCHCTRVSSTACCMMPPMQQEDAQFGRRRCIVCLGMQVHVAAAQARNPGPNHREGGPTDCGLLPHILRHLPCLCTVLLHGAIALEIFEPIRHARL